jgi:transcriptional regulator with XRE-family HTH domain
VARTVSRHAHGRSEIWSRAALEKAILRERAHLGRRLRAVRERKGLTQEQAAEQIGIHPKHLGRVEGGTGNPTISTLIALALAYGVRLPALFEDDDAARSKG